MKSYSKSNILHKEPKLEIKDFKAKTSSNFHQNIFNKSPIQTDYEAFQSGKDIKYFRDILGYSNKCLFHKYNQGNYSSMMNKKLKEIRDISTDEIHPSYLITLPKNNIINKKPVIINKTEILSTEQTKSSIYVNENNNTKATTIKPEYDLDEYYHQMSFYPSKTMSNNYNDSPLKFSQTETLSFRNKSTNRQTKRVLTSYACWNQLACVNTRNPKVRKELSQVKKDIIFSFIQDHHQPDKYLDAVLYPPSKKKKKKGNDDLPEIENEDAKKTSSLLQKFSLPSKNHIYRIPYTQKSIRENLKKEVSNLLLDMNSNENNNDDEGFPKTIRKHKTSTTLTDYTYTVLSKIKFVNNFLYSIPQNDFYSKKPRHRNIYVILDGTVVFNDTYISGRFIEIPSLRFLSFLENKKERMTYYFKFLATCQLEFSFHKPVKGLFLLNGTRIEDLAEIPEIERGVYITQGTIFQGVHIMGRQERKIKEKIEAKDIKLLETKPTKLPYGKKPFGVGQMFKKKKVKSQGVKQYKTITKKRQYLLDQSFTNGLSYNDDIIEFAYYSDNEDKKRTTARLIKMTYPSRLDHILYLSKGHLSSKLSETLRKNTQKKNKKLKKYQNEQTTAGLTKLVDIYNKNRSDKYKLNVSHQLQKDLVNQREMDAKTQEMMVHFLKKLKIFQNYDSRSVHLDSKAFYGTRVYIPDHLHKNISKTEHIIQSSNNKIEKYYPDLIAFNIPRILSSFPKLKRREFYDIFIQFKTLLKICVVMNNNIRLIEKGIDFETFFNCNPQMKYQGVELAHKIFTEINSLNEKMINWEKYMFGMLTMKNKEINDKIDLFLGIIDSDKNGNLSYEEVFELSMASLGRSFNYNPQDDKDPESIIFILGEFFTKLIFSLVDRPLNEEIPIDEIKNKILEGGKATSYLEMFICADNFT